ncbi:MAG: flagellar export protein FliJ [Rubrivivax sp.]|nr:flagellar export protein FliJ [Rubrivivax sp.]
MNATLQLLHEQAERERDLTMARLHQAEEALRSASLQADQLCAYREDYRQRAPALNGRGVHIELVRCHHGFMQRLDQALDQQNDTVRRHQEGAAALREALLVHEMRVAAIGRLLRQRAAQATRLAARQDQRDTDEAAQRLATVRPVAMAPVDAAPGHADEHHARAAAPGLHH